MERVRAELELGLCGGRTRRGGRTGSCAILAIGKKAVWMHGNSGFFIYFFHQGKKVPYPVSEHSTVLHFAAIYASMCFQLVTSLFKTD